ncbi:MAG TPA: hypothetical protein VML96_12370 [Egibacteraceae bacterium]|nr:hypothetical protein [Egibacteraceae bacterium]
MELDEETWGRLERAIEVLAEEFAGIVSRDTIRRYIDDSLDRWLDARLTLHVPLLVHRFARQRLRALAQAEGWAAKTVPEVLFVCERNAGRSQIAAAVVDHRAEGRVHVRSAGTAPADRIPLTVLDVMAEAGIPLAREFPKPFTDEVVRAADIVVTMGCGEACPVLPGKRYLDWDVADPDGRSHREVQEIVQEIDLLARDLLDELVRQPVG